MSAVKKQPRKKVARKLDLDQSDNESDEAAVSGDDSGDEGYTSADDSDKDAGGTVVSDENLEYDSDYIEDTEEDSDPDGERHVDACRSAAWHAPLHGRTIYRNPYGGLRNFSDDMRRSYLDKRGNFVVLPYNCVHMAAGFCDKCSPFKNFECDMFIDMTLFGGS